MRILHKYILAEWFRAFFCMLLATVGLLIAEDIYKNLHNFIQCGSTIKGILSYYLWFSVSICPLTIPIAFFLSVLFSLGKLQRSNELLSMRTIGLNIFQITSPLLLIGGLLSIASLFFNVCLSSTALQKTRDFCANLSAAEISYRLAFNNERCGRMWFLGELNRRTLTGSDAMLYFYDSSGSEISRVFAETFSYESGIWSFFNGFSTIFNGETHCPVRMTKFERMDCKYGESPELFLSMAKRIKHLSFAEIRRILSFSNGSFGYAAYRVRYYDSIASALSCLLIALITIPFATIGIGRNPVARVSKACGMLVVFFAFVSVFKTLGSNGILPAMLSICLPYCFVLLPIYPLYKRCA
jgi:lipopolysaccharide export LptBFGC system permease protein LptF